MNPGNVILLVILGAGALAAGVWFGRRFFSADARWERRRRRSNAPISSSVRRPMVKFNVRLKKERRK